jgi:hypothetical protein
MIHKAMSTVRRPTFVLRETAGGTPLATLLATPSIVHGMHNEKSPVPRAFLDGPAWIRTKDQGIMSRPRMPDWPRPAERKSC